MYLLLQHRAQINAEDCNSMRPLVVALSMRKEGAAVVLIEMGARITNPIPTITATVDGGSISKLRESSTMYPS